MGFDLRLAVGFQSEINEVSLTCDFIGAESFKGVISFAWLSACALSFANENRFFMAYSLLGPENVGVRLLEIWEAPFKIEVVFSLLEIAQIKYVWVAV